MAGISEIIFSVWAISSLFGLCALLNRGIARYGWSPFPASLAASIVYLNGLLGAVALIKYLE
jgi:hypothetical protein